MTYDDENTTAPPVVVNLVPAVAKASAQPTTVKPGPVTINLTPANAGTGTGNS